VALNRGIRRRVDVRIDQHGSRTAVSPTRSITVSVIGIEIDGPIYRAAKIETLHPADTVIVCLLGHP
jgi:hypothetical protein